MPPHALGSGTISFGLVSIPVKLYTATSAGNVSFNLLHAKCGSRIKQQTFCPVCNETVERSGLVKGYEFTKDQYVRVADDELKALEGEASKMIDILEFVPLAQVDPVYFEKAYYLGADKGGEKPYRLIAAAMAQAEQYTDEYRKRVLDMLERKVEGREVTAAPAPAERPHVIDLMEALKASLAKKGLPAEAATAKKPPSKAAQGAAPKVAAKAVPKRASGGRK